MRSLTFLCAVSCLAVTAACSSTGSSGSAVDAGGHDAATSVDAGKRPDASKGDAATHDASKPDASKHDAATHDAATHDAGSAETGAGDAAACNGSVVPAFVTSNLTLTKACSPWHAPMPVYVGDTSSTPVLTIEPGVTVEFDDGAFFYIAQGAGNDEPGALHAVGTASDPIVLTSSDASPQAGAWSGVYFAKMSDPSSILSYAKVEYAGGPIFGTNTSPHVDGSIVVDSGMSATSLQIALSNVTVQHNSGTGILFFGPLAGFAPSSGALTIVDWGTGGYPIAIDGSSADTLPTTVTTGASGHDGAIGLYAQDGDIGSGGEDPIVRDVTWPSMPIPYVVDSTGYSSGECGILVDGTATEAITLTIAAPNTVEFQSPSGCGLYVNTNQLPTGFPGSVVANGTSTAEITFTSASATPAAGDWLGVQIFLAGGLAEGASSFTYCTFSYANGYTRGGDYTAEIWLDGYPCGPGSGIDAGPSLMPIISNCTFTNFGDVNACGIYSLDVGAATTYSGDNTFEPTGSAMGTCYATAC